MRLKCSATRRACPRTSCPSPRKVAFYFAWMDFYTLWLLAPAVLGVCAHLLSVSVDRSTWAPMYSLFVVFWGILFVKFWARRCAHLAMEFRILDMGYDEDEVRSEYRGRLRKSYVTGHMERYFSPWQRLPRYAVSVLVSAAMLVVAFAVMVCSLNLQGYVSGPDPDTPTPAHAAAPPAGQGLELLFACPFHIPALARLASPGALFDPDGWPSLVPVLAHVAVVKLLNKLYSRMAKRLTRYENHRTEAEHENALVVKRFLFEAFDNYLALFYVGFYELDTERLRSEMVALYSIDSARRVFMETLLPLLLHWLQYSRKSRQAGRPKGAAPTETPPAVPPHPRQGSGWVKPRWTLRFSWHSGKDQSQPTDNVDVGKGDAATTKSEITTIRHEAGAEKTEAMTTALEGKPKSLRYRRLSGKAVEGKVSGGMACSDSILAGLDLRVLGPMLVQDANSKRLLSLTNGEDAHLKPLGLHQNGSAQNGVARLYSKVLAAKVPPVPLEAASVTVARLAPGKTGHEPSAGTLERGGPGGGSGSGKPRKGKGPLRRKLRETSRVLERCLSTVLDPSAPSVAEQLVCEEYDQFEDYLEMVIQFGYITLFASAYPLAAALSLVCNFVEIKSDSFKLMYLVRRPRPLKVRGIGIWTSLVHILVWTSIVTNSLIFSVSSEQMQVWFPYFFSEGPQGGHEFIPGRGRYAVGLTFLLEHAIGVLALVLMVAISDTPAAVKRERERREYERATRAREARHKKLLEMVQQRMQK
eukprot:jgi/Mesvir1/4009/Mv03702-RA.2